MGGMSWSPLKGIQSRELTYPTLGKGKSSSKCHFEGYVSSLEGILVFLFRNTVVTGFPGSISKMNLGKLQRATR